MSTTITYNRIPATLRVPGNYAEIDNTQALRGLIQFKTKSLLIGQMTDDGTATANEPVLVQSYQQANDLFGPGSMLARMFEFYKRNDRFVETWALPLADNGSGVAAEGTVTFTGTVTASGTFNLYIGGRRVQVGVTAGDSVTTIAAALVAAVTADPTLPVTAANTAGVVTLTAKNAGVNGNGIDIRANYYGAPGGETTPAGLTATIVAMASGATNPVLTTGLAALSDEQYDFIAFPYTDTTSLNAIKAELADRWDWDRAIMGHAFAAKVDTVGNLTTFGNGRNDENTSVVGIYNTPTPAEEIAAAVTAQVGLAASNHPARPFGTLPLVGVKAPPKPDLFTTSERDTLYYDGISCTLTQDDGTVRLDRLITTYQQNAFSVPDASYLDYNTRAQLAYIRMTYMYKFGLKFQAGRFILVGDNVKNPNNYQIRPKDIKAEAVAIYGLLIDHGVCENMAGFIEELIVEIDDADPNRVNMLIAPDMANQLQITATSIRFHL